MNRNALTLGILLLLVNICLFAQEEKIGDVSDGNRARPVHLIKLIDHDSSIVEMDDQPMMPFSTEYTCGSCHDYKKISHGWHFNAGTADVQDGRPGHPWIYFDQQSSTQIPVSLRSWSGTYKPEQIGLSPLNFYRLFGRHMPGGGLAEVDSIRWVQNAFRWMVSGDLEINCLTCHDAEFSNDHAEYASQTGRENFRWAATAASGIAAVEGSARDMPDTYDIYSGASSDIPGKVAPRAFYDKSRFNRKSEVFLKITRKVPDENCYFCHSTQSMNPDNKERWHSNGDVHLNAGMACVDCHRHGLDHQMTRGGKNEASEPVTASLTCEGCHLGETPLTGKSGAPRPDHAGIPPVHFEEMTCTSCHSGQWPVADVQRVKTSSAHGLGMHGIVKSPTMLPHIASPVFVENDRAQIEPRNLIWPAFWARLDGDSLVPANIDLVKAVTAVIVINDDTLHTGNWLKLSTDDIARITDSLTVANGNQGIFGYVGGGYLYRRNEQGQVIRQDHPAAQPYSWAIAHDVRPARQALGVNGCADCHATDSPFQFATLAIDSPLDLYSDTRVRMTEFQDNNTIAAWVFSFSFLFRPGLKLIVIISALIITGVFVLYIFRGLQTVTRTSAGDKQKD